MAIVLVGCGDETSSDADRLADELITETGGALDETQAACVAQGLVQSFGDESFQEVIDAAQGDGEGADDVRVEVIDLFSSCDALESVVLDGTGDESPG